RSFIADAAHELRSPLTAVRLQLQLLERAPDESAREQARGALGAAVERAVHLVSQLLTLARNEPQDARARELVPLPLAEPAAEAVADTHALALSRGVELSLDAPVTDAVCGVAAGAGAAVVRADREALRILVRNLVDNAVRYTPTGGRVEVRIGAEAPNTAETGAGPAPGTVCCCRSTIPVRASRPPSASMPSTASIAALRPPKRAAGWGSPSCRSLR